MRGATMRRVATVAVFSLVLAALGIGFLNMSATGRQDDPFPHAFHSGLFVFCTGCHEGVPYEDRTAFYPDPALCAQCHDGADLPRVDWTPPSATEPDPIVFSHVRHDRFETLACERCHTPAGADRMAVRQQVEVQRCFSCHAHEARDHYVDADCGACHMPAAETPMGGRWLAMLPYPEDHVRGDFLSTMHGALSAAEPERCSTCHTQERCTSCHVDAAQVPQIAAIPPAAPDLELPRFAAHYFTPPSHHAPNFEENHGTIASFQACATCHTRNDCAACHTSELPASAMALPRAQDVRAPGVLLAGRVPPSHMLASFIERHGPIAAANPAVCTSCHTRTFCADCHEASMVRAQLPHQIAGPQFHPPNYQARHSAEAYNRRLECSSCHNVSTFCRDCHQEAGFQAVGRLDVGFHDAEPLWLLRHGQPARHALESCASCHVQSDCIQCHSVIGSFRVNPHGRDFDARRAWERNPSICFACHIDTPVF
jgi:predicted CXXCH cytochrome family protein